MGREWAIRACAAGLVGCAAGLAGAQTETFQGGSNAAGWTFGAPVEVIQPSGGDPGAYLRGSMIDTTIPFLRTTVSGTGFTGNYRAAGVTGVQVSLNVFHTDFNIGQRAPAVILYSDNGTPADPLDDWGAYELGDHALLPAGAWSIFEFPIPAGQGSLPAGWQFIQFGPNSPSPSWDALVQNVSSLQFSFGDPSLFYIVQMWDVGADTIALTTRQPTCYPNCDHGTSIPFLNVNDFICFQARFAAGDSYANCDGSTTPPVLNVNDFVCFQSLFAAGCSAP